MMSVSKFAPPFGGERQKIRVIGVTKMRQDVVIDGFVAVGEKR